MTSESTASPTGDIANDLLSGIDEISSFTGLPRRKLYYMAATGLLPGVFKRGRNWHGLKSEISAGLRSLAKSGVSARAA